MPLKSFCSALNVQRWQHAGVRPSASMPVVSARGRPSVSTQDGDLVSGPPTPLLPNAQPSPLQRPVQQQSSLSQQPSQQQQQQAPSSSAQAGSRFWFFFPRSSMNKAPSSQAETGDGPAQAATLSSSSPIEMQATLPTPPDVSVALPTGSSESVGGARVTSPPSRFVKSVRLTSEAIKKLDLKPGMNTITYSVVSKFQVTVAARARADVCAHSWPSWAQGTTQCTACIYLWDDDSKVVISDFDGTITRSDVMGQVMPGTRQAESVAGPASSSFCHCRCHHHHHFHHHHHHHHEKHYRTVTCALEYRYADNGAPKCLAATGLMAVWPCCTTRLLQTVTS
jgi:hypothetical protein